MSKEAEFVKTISKEGDPQVDVLERDAESNSENALEPDVEELPKVVREIVPLEDDPTIPVLTFRYFILSIIFIIPGAFIDTMNSFRTTSAAYSIFLFKSHHIGVVNG